MTSDPLKLMFSVSGHLWPHPTNSSGLRCYLSLVNSISSWKSLCIKSRTLTVSFQGYRWSKKPVIGLDKTIVNNLKVQVIHFCFLKILLIFRFTLFLIEPSKHRGQVGQIWGLLGILGHTQPKVIVFLVHISTQQIKYINAFSSEILTIKEFYSLTGRGYFGL